MLLRRSMFDLFVVSMSLVALGPISMPVSVVRLMRAFRCMTLFTSLRNIDQISQLGRACPMIHLTFMVCPYKLVGLGIFSQAFPSSFFAFLSPLYLAPFPTSRACRHRRATHQNHICAAPNGLVVIRSSRAERYPRTMPRHDFQA